MKAIAAKMDLERLVSLAHLDGATARALDAAHRKPKKPSLVSPGACSNPSYATNQASAITA